MKKLVIGVLIVVIVISLFGCANNIDGIAQNQTETTQKPSEMEENGAIQINDKTEYILGAGSPKYGPGFIKKNVEQLETDSDVIIKATVLSSKSPDPELIKDMPIGAVKPEEVCVTLTTVRIDEVIKSDNDFKEENEIVVLENYRASLNPNDNKIYIDSRGGTLPMKQGDQYLLFLTKVQPDAEVDYGGDFYLTGDWQGKYAISQKIQNASNISELTNEDLEFWDHMGNGDLKKLMTLAEQVYTKYIW